MSFEEENESGIEEEQPEETEIVGGLIRSAPVVQ